jgi:hypothetical protein
LWIDDAELERLIFLCYTFLYMQRYNARLRVSLRLLRCARSVYCTHSTCGKVRRQAAAGNKEWGMAIGICEFASLIGSLFNVKEAAIGGDPKFKEG